MGKRERYVYNLYGLNPVTKEYQKWRGYAELEEVFESIRENEQDERHWKFKVNRVRVVDNG